MALSQALVLEAPGIVPTSELGAPLLAERRRAGYNGSRPKSDRVRRMGHGVHLFGDARRVRRPSA